MARQATGAVEKTAAETRALQAQALSAGAIRAGADDTRVGPDPLTLILPAFAALGGIASIAALNWAAQTSDDARRQTRRPAAGVLRNLERDCLDLQEAFRRLVRGLPGITSGGGTTALPMKFGVHGLDVTPQSYPLYQSLLASLSSLVARTCQHSHDLMGAIEDGSIEPPEEVFFAFGDQQDRLNQLFAHPRPSLKNTVEMGYDVAVKLSALIDELGAYKRD